MTNESSQLTAEPPTDEILTPWQPTAEYLTAEQELHLMESYRTLGYLADNCRVPAVLAAVRASLAELRIALDGQAVEFDYYRNTDRVLGV
ncbi:DUF6052 family protein [Streptomyces sp. BE308]|uniref:DUF6052 family protein n=1 Tax=unclassified Streptomyces TaxID=2593676 RepID=UPI002DD8F996|nr:MULTISPECIES: DUF6052 family protein [unclassified Streptomyces]MEE1791163.1 DUF6052 family protein [Streptomyces sp. BE308]WRZ78612.1 DUF6052 family protein [Streptomyces sp. NBC_01237]